MSTLFISHSSSDNEAAKELSRRLAEPPRNHHSVFLDLDPEQGIVAGQSWEQTLYRKLRSCRAVIALITDTYLGSQWCFAEIALARMEGKHIFALLVDGLGDAAKLPGILTEKQFIDLRQDPEQGYRRLWKGLEELDLIGVSGEWDPKQSPYLGLRAYQEKHAAVFFGRGGETRAGIELLERGAPGLIMVLGSSGSGKSSLVRAGMVPRLRRNTDRWLVADPFRPQRDPVAELAESLAAAYRRYAPDEAAREGSKERLRAKLEAGLPRAPVAEAEPESEAAAEGAAAPSAEEGMPPAAAVADEPSAAADERLRNLLSQLEELRRSPPDGAGPPVMKFLDWSLDDLRRICGAAPEGPAAAPAAGPAGSPLVEIADHLRRASGRQNARLLLIVDQFEELLGRDGPGDKAHRFLQMLRDAVEIEHSPLMVLGTMRSDFLGLFQRNRALRDVDFESLSVGPMSVDAMRRVIEEPAKLGAIELESGLADRLLADTETPDALPLLSFTLWRLWEDRKDGRLSVGQYEALGGLQGAVAREAETVLESARKQGQEDDVRAAFLEMARLTEDGSYARQPVSWERPELVKVKPVLEAFEKRRLLVTRQEEGESAATLEVAHEALFRSWAPLVGWLDNNRSELLLKQQLRRDARAWEESDRAVDSLWRGGRLQQAHELMVKDGLGAREAPDVEGSFVRAGVRRRTIRRWTGIGIAALFFLGLGVVLIIVNNERSKAVAAKEEAEEQTRIANSGRLASASLIARLDRPDVASLQAIEAFNSADTFDARNALLLGLQNHPRLEIFLRPGVAVSSLAFAPDGTFASGARDGTIRFWRLGESGATQIGEPLQGHKGPVLSVAFGPDGALASMGEDRAVKLWRLGESDTTRLGEPLSHAGQVASVAFAPDGTLASGGADGNVMLWRLGEPGATQLGEPLPHGGGGPVLSLAFAPDGTLASGGGDGTVKLWRLGESGATQFGEPLPLGRPVYSVAFAPDGTLAAGSIGEVHLWRFEDSSMKRLDVEMNEQFYRLRGRVRSLAFARDGTLVSLVEPESQEMITYKRVFFWRLEEAGASSLREALLGHEGSVESVAFAAHKTLLASGGMDGTVRLSRLGESSAIELGEPLFPGGSVHGVAFAPDGTLASGGAAGNVRLWQLASSGAKQLGEPQAGHAGTVYSVAFAPDGTLLASGGEDGAVRLWRPSASGAKQLGEPLPGHKGSVYSVAFAADKTLLASGGVDGTVRLWRLSEAGAKPLGEPLLGHERAVYSVAFAADKTLLASAGVDRTVRLWRLSEAGAKPLGEPLLGHEGTVYSVAFAPDGTLASGGLVGEDPDLGSGVVRLWRLGESGATPLGEPMLEDDPVHSVAFALDGTLASASGKLDFDRRTVGTVKLSRLGESGATPFGEPLLGDEMVVWSVAFHGDGTLASGGSAAMRLWQLLDMDFLEKLACRRASRNFSLAEWRKYIGENEPYRCTCLDHGPGENVSAERSTC